MILTHSQRFLLRIKFKACGILSFILVMIGMMIVSGAVGSSEYYISSYVGKTFPETQTSLPMKYVSINPSCIFSSSSTGEIYLCDSMKNVIWKVNMLTKTLDTIAGGGNGIDMNPSVATQLSLVGPKAGFLNSKNEMFLADSGNYLIRKIDANGKCSIIAGSTTSKNTTDGGKAIETKIINPSCVCGDEIGNIYFCTDNRIRKIGTDGILSTYAGTTTQGYSGDGGLATKAKLNNPSSCVVSAEGDVYIADYNRVRVISATSGNISTVVGSSSTKPESEGMNALDVYFSKISTVYFDNNGDLYVSDYYSNIVRRVAKDGKTYTVKIMNKENLYYPAGVAVSSGDVFILDGLNQGRFFQISNGEDKLLISSASNGDGEVSTYAKVSGPYAVFSTETELYIADNGHNSIRKVFFSNKTITTIAGTGSRGSPQTGALAVNSQIGQVGGIYVAENNDIYFTDSDHHCIRKISNGIITTIAGIEDKSGFADGAASSAKMNNPEGIFIYNSEIFFSDAGNHIIRKIDKNMVITTIAGTVSQEGYAGDGDSPLNAKFSTPRGISISPNGTIFVADTGNSRIRRIANGIIETIAGKGEANYDFANPTDIAIEAALNEPWAVYYFNEEVYFTDYRNALIRKITVDGKLIRIAGMPMFHAFMGEDVVVMEDNTGFFYLRGITGNKKGELFVAESMSDKVRILSPYNSSADFTCSGLLKYDSQVCNGKGLCVSSDNCECNDGYTGLNCEVVVCYGKLSNESNSCSGNGYCTLPNTCSCKYSVFGNQCQFFSCFGISSSENNTCNSNGQCVSANKCSCNTDWKGEKCDVFNPHCFDISSDNALVCSGRGSCVSTNKCNCINGFGGESCDEFYCNNISKNDTLVCGSKGSCIGPNTCNCSEGYGGVNCEPFCFGFAQSDSRACSNNGTCVDLNNCKCKRGFYGDICQVVHWNETEDNDFCFGIRNNETLVCSGNGKCLYKDQCSCNLGYLGDECQFISCDGFSSVDPYACYSRGNCTSYNMCACESKYEGRYCQFEKKTIEARYMNMTLVMLPIAGYNALEDGIDALTSYVYGPNFHIANGFLYLADGLNQLVRKIDLNTRKIYTIAGQAKNSGFKDGPASLALFDYVQSVFATDTGVIYIVDRNNNALRKFDPISGNVSTIAGTGEQKLGGENIDASMSTLYSPTHVRVNSAGEVYVSEYSRIRKIGNDGKIVTIAGTVSSGFSGDGKLATACQLSAPKAFFLNSDGSILIGDSGNRRIRKISANGIISTIAGNGQNSETGSSNPLSTGFDDTDSVIQNSAGEIFIADTWKNKIRKISSDLTTISTVAGNGQKPGGFSGDNGLATNAKLYGPSCVGIYQEDIFIGDSANNRIRRVSNDGIISTFAGSGSFGSGSDNVIATTSQLYEPTTIVFKGEDLLIADSNNRKIKQLSATTGFITTILGTGVVNDYTCNDNSNPLKCGTSYPTGLSLSPENDLIFVDMNYNYILRLYNSNNTVTSIGGVKGYAGYTGDNNAATSAQINIVRNTLVAPNGDIYISDSNNNRIRKISNKIITTIAGTGTAGGLGDGGLATSAQLNSPTGLCMSSKGELYFADEKNHKIRKISKNGIIETVVGTGSLGFSPDGTEPLLTYLNGPKHAIFIGSELYVLDSGNNKILKFDTVSKSNITTVIGKMINGNVSTILLRELNNPNHMAYNNGQLVVSDFGSHQILSLQPVCFGVESRNPNVCSGMGVCNSPNNCTCRNNFFGADCSLYNCYGTLYTNETVCNGNGRCDTPNNCTCKLGWVGQYCNISIPTHQCYGIFNFDSSVCSGKGSCISKNVCNCTTGYGGQHCEYKICNGIFSNNVSVCSSRGVCTLPNTCKCDSDYLGNDCQYFNCFGKPANSPVVCSGHGKCIEPWNCECDPDYDQEDCSVPKCFGIPAWNGPQVCSNRGSCIAVNNCSCTTGYFGEKCNIPMCYGILSNSSSVCSGRGACKEYNSCDCTPPYYGSKCEKKQERFRLQYSIKTTAGYDPETTPLPAEATYITPYGIFATDDYLYISSSACIRQVDLKTKTTKLIAGFESNAQWTNDVGPFDNVLATSARLKSPDGISLYNNGLYFVDWNVQRALRVDLISGNISNVAGNGEWGFSWGEDLVATETSLSVPNDIVVAPNGYIFIADTSNNRIRVVINGTINTICGNSADFTGDNGPAKYAKINAPKGLFLTKEGDLLIADLGNYRIRKISNVVNSLGDGIITTVAGNGKKAWTGDGGSALSASFNYPSSVVSDSYGNIYICDYYNHLIRKVSNETGNVTTIAGARVMGSWGGQWVPIGSEDSNDPKPAINATLQFPMRLAINRDSLYISDTNNKKVRMINLQSGIISTVAGYGQRDYNGDNKLANVTTLGEVFCVQYYNGEIYFTVRTLHIIRKITKNGTIQTIAGTIGKSGYSGDNGPASKATFNYPLGLYISPIGEIYVADSENFVIRKISKGGNITTIVGTKNGWPTNGYDALESTLGGIISINMLSTGELIFCEGNFIRKVGKDGKLAAIAGGSQVYFKDNVPATESAMYSRNNIIVTPSDEIYFICDSSGQRLRKISKDGIISTVLGNAKSDYGPDNVVITEKTPVAGLFAIALTNNGEIVIRESTRIRKILSSGFIYTIAGSSSTTNYGYNGDFKRASMATLGGSTGKTMIAVGEKLIFTDYFPDMISPSQTRIRELTPFIPYCFSKIANDTSVCTSRGDCIDQDVCSCDSPYYGLQCTEFDCFGIWRNNSNVCYSNGACTSPDFCNCSSLYTGAKCEIPICFGYDANNSRVCSYRNGTCIKGNVCQCSANYTGYNCQFPICYGKSSNETDVCSGHGQCFLPDNCCNCKNGYTGKNCEIPICFNKTAMEIDVCSGNGSCISPDYCNCTEEYFGKMCEITRCYGRFSNQSNVCSGNGLCQSPNNCICNSNYTGNDCQFPICYDLSANDTNVCSTHGKCVNPNQCTCDNGYFGEYCNITACFGILSTEIEHVCSSNGTCVGPDTCLCMEGFDGANCELKICNGSLSNDSFVCSGHGSCERPDTCQCQDGYYGEWCELFTCFSVSFDSNSSCSGHGSCISHDTCACNSNYYGNNCEVTKCFGSFSNTSTVCSSFGSCVLPNNCQCNEGYYGQQCELYNCNSTLFNSSNVCSGNGACKSPDNCQCFDGYSGELCQYLSCNGILSSNESVCSGRGVCEAPNKCLCYSQNNTKVFGQDCEKLQCLGESGKFYSPSSSKVCSGRGICGNNGCDCNKGYLGEYCHIETCYDIPSTDSRTCSGRGRCVSLDKCICMENETLGYWGGSVCDVCLPSYSGANCLQKICNETTTCSSHGKCNETTLDCECSGGWDGRFCDSCKKNLFGDNCDVFCESTSTCSAHGQCNSTGSCECYHDKTNGFWSSSSCNSCLANYDGELCSTYFIGPAQFTDLGNGISLQVFGPSSLASVNVDCSKLLSREEKNLFGEGVVCMWTNKESGSFLIQFGEGYELRPGMSISLNRLVFDQANSTDFETMAVLNAKNPIKPVSVISNIRDSFGLCDEVEIDGSKSYSGDRKSLIFNWEWIQVPDTDLSNLFNISDTTKNTTIRLPSSCSEGLYSISLFVKSSLSGAESNKVIFTFTKSGLPLPIVSIVGKNSVTIKSTEIPYVIKPEVTLPPCFYENKNTSISWKQTSGPKLNTITDSLGNLIITGFTSKIETQYDFEVEVKSVENPISKSTAKSSVSVTFEELILTTFLSEIYAEKASVNAEFDDPDDSDEIETWLWACKEQVTLDFCEDAIDSQLASVSSQKNSSFDLIPGEMKNIILTLTIKKGSRSKFSDLVISFPKAQIIPPLISLLSVNPRTTYVVRGDLFSLQLSVSIGGKEDGIDIQRQWLLNSLPISNVLTSQMSSDPETSNSIVLDTTTLEEGASYTLSLNVTATQTQLSALYSQIFKIARSPQSCVCSVTPSTGYIIDTEFKFECLNCQNQEKTIDFIYGYIDESSGSQVPLYILGEAFPTRLPPPDDGQSNTIRTFIKIVDTSTGASCTKNQNVNILYPMVNNRDELLAKMMEWDTLLNEQLANSNPSKIAVTGATMSKAVNILAMRIFNPFQSRSLKQTCLNGGSYDSSTSKCICTNGFVKEDCSLSVKDQDLKNQMRQTTVKNYVKSLKLRNSAELLSETYLKTQLVGLSPVIQAYDEINPSLFNSVCSIMANTLTLAQNNKNLKLTTVEGLLKSFFISMDNYLKYNSIKDGETHALVLSLISDYSAIIVRNKDVGQTPFIIETNALSLLTSKNYMDQLSSKTFVSLDARVKTPSMISRFLKSYPKRKPLTFSMKTSTAFNSTYTINARKTTISTSIISKYLVDYSLQEYKLTGMTDYIRYEIPLVNNPSNSSYLTTNPVEVLLSKTSSNDIIASTYRLQYLICLSKDSTNQLTESEDCLFEYDTKLPNYGICKCSKQASVAIALKVLDRVVIEDISKPTNNSPSLEYLGFLAFLILPILITVILIIVVVKCCIKKKNPAPKEPPQNIEMGIV